MLFIDRWLLFSFKRVLLIVNPKNYLKRLINHFSNKRPKIGAGLRRPLAAFIMLMIKQTSNPIQITNESK